jgi:dUTP pyrophosphatase
MNIKIINKSNNSNPEYETAQSAGMDLRAYLENEKELTIWPGETKIISTGLYLEIPDGTEMQIRSRSGLAAKQGLVVLNSPGTIDPDYRGEIKIILHNTHDTEHFIHNGDRIAQAVFAPYVHVRLDNVEELSDTNRGEGGLGSTGTK